MLAIVPLSFSSSTFLVYPIPGWSLRWYRTCSRRTNGAWRAKNSFIVAPSATVVATVLGTLAAVGLHARRTSAARALLMARADLADDRAGRSSSASACICSSRRSAWPNTYIGLILAHAALGAPFVRDDRAARRCRASTTTSCARACSLGASPLTTFFRITLPVIAPGVISGALFAFATSFDEVVVTLFLAGAEQMTLPRQMFTGIRENISPTIAALATILIVFSTSLLLALEWLRGRAAARAVAA